MNAFYYGVRFAANAEPADLWVTYFTSSKYVNDFTNENGPPDIIEIRRTFNSADDARKWESKALRRLNAVKDNRFLNKTDNIAIQDSKGEISCILTSLSLS